jgi:lipopolysaccharide export system permease protein
MKVLRRLIYRDAISSVAFVTLAFLALFFFFDLIDELRWVGRTGGEVYKPSHALLFVLLSLPSHLYELLPITVLIGTIYVMARLAQSSEFTIMRTSGMGPWMALRTLLVLGCGFAVLTFAIGDYIAPAAERTAQLIKAAQLGRLSTGATGAWLKERQGEHSFAVNVNSLGKGGELTGVRIFEFNAQGRMASQTHADSATVDADKDVWTLHDVARSTYVQKNGQARLERTQQDKLDWPTRISAEMISASLLKPDRMATIDLFQYVRHLESNGQSAQKYEIEFWRKVFYPLSCLVMVVLALPFAYLHFRSGGIAAYVFGGVMAGISFFLLNNVFGYAGNLQNWSPMLTAAAPGFIYSLLSLGAFAWLVLRR